jgi:Cu/Ag efflux pump CusA
LSVPTALIATFLAIDLSGETLNLMSLGGMAIAIGLVIDDAIVVVEAIALRLEGETRPRCGDPRAPRDHGTRRGHHDHDRRCLGTARVPVGARRAVLLRALAITLAPRFSSPSSSRS